MGEYILELVLNIRFITGIIFVLIGIYLLYLVKQDRAKLIVRGEVRLTFGPYQAYFVMLGGIYSIFLATIRWLIPELPSWVNIPLGLIVFALIVITLRKSNIRQS